MQWFQHVYEKKISFFLFDNTNNQAKLYYIICRLPFNDIISFNNPNMLAFSLPKKQNAFSFAQQSTIKPFYSNSNVSSNDTTVRESPAPATANTDRNKCKN
jgi:hypothetical protein